MKPPTLMVEDIPGLRGLVVRRLLEAPDTPVAEIRQMALSRYPAVERLSVREFGARYVVPLKRRMRKAPPRRPRPAHAPPPTPPTAPRTPPAESSDLPLLDAAISDARQSQRGSTSEAPPGRANGEGSPAPVGEAEASPPHEGAAANGTPDGGRGRSSLPGSTPVPAVTTAGVVPEEPGPGDTVEELRMLFFRLAYEMSIEDTDVWLVETVAGLDRYVQEAARVLTRGRPTVGTPGAARTRLDPAGGRGWKRTV